MRTLAALVVLAGGCSVEVGAGSIAPVTVDEPVDPAGSSPPVSLPMEIDFLTADDSASIDDQYGSKLGAVRAVDISVTALDLTDDASGAAVSGGTLVVAMSGVTISQVGQRVRMPDEQQKQLLAAIRARAALTLPVTATVSWPEPPPASMTAHAVVQPIFIVDALSAL